MQVRLVLDVGSSSVRCSAFDPCHALAYRTCLPYRCGPEGDADALVALVEQCLDECLSGLRARATPTSGRAPTVQVLSLGTACLAMSLVGARPDNGAFAAVTPLFTYASAASPTTGRAPCEEHFARTGTIAAHPRYRS